MLVRCLYFWGLYRRASCHAHALSPTLSLLDGLSGSQTAPVPGNLTGLEPGSVAWKANRLLHYCAAYGAFITAWIQKRKISHLLFGLFNTCIEQGVAQVQELSTAAYPRVFVHAWGMSMPICSIISYNVHKRICMQLSTWVPNLRLFVWAGLEHVTPEVGALRRFLNTEHWENTNWMCTNIVGMVLLPIKNGRRISTATLPSCNNNPVASEQEHNWNPYDSLNCCIEG